MDTASGLGGLADAMRASWSRRCAMVVAVVVACS
jgi:hypothetical protein